MSDLTQSGTTLLLALINTHLTTQGQNNPLSTSNVTIGTPAAATGGETDNTLVTITSIAGHGYTGSIDINYNRIDIGLMFTNKSIQASLTSGASYTNAVDLLPPLNTKYSLDLQASDIVDGAIGSGGTFPFHYTLTIASGSLTYIGTLDVELDT